MTARVRATGARPSVFDRIQERPSTIATCKFWRVGRCNRHPCPFLHGETHPAIATATQTQADHGDATRRPNVWMRLGPTDTCGAVQQHQQQQQQQGNSKNKVPTMPRFLAKKHLLDDNSAERQAPVGPQAKGREATDETPQSQQQECVAKAPFPEEAAVHVREVQMLHKDVAVCRSFLAGECRLGENCCALHRWFTGNCFTHLVNLQGHTKEIVGITLPCESNKLLTASRDGTVAIWDCATAQSIQVLNSGCEINCLLSDGPWVFIGCHNAIQACNTLTWTSNTETLEVVTLPVPSGPVHAMAAGHNILFAGIEDGSILSWKMNEEDKKFELAAVLLGHHGAVVSLTVGEKRLYSGSVDNTIRVWDILTLEYIDTLTDHCSVVTSLLCWNCFLFSSSLDHTIKVWGQNENNVYKLVYTLNEKHAALALEGMLDAQGQPVLMCSYDDKTIRLYDLPTFNERGKIFSIDEIKVMKSAPSDIFFTGDGAGKLNVWKWST